MVDSIARRSPRVDGNFAVPRPSTALTFTGERMTTEMEGQIEYEHYHRYCLARDLADSLDVLDVAAGEGYGSALLAGVARSVTGVEIDPASVAHAQASYVMSNLRFLTGDALALPIDDASMDVVVSFETMEHLADHQRFIAEARRVLRPGGLLIVSTPDRMVYSAAASEPNPYHLLELTAAELDALLTSHFTHHSILSQRPVLGSVICAPQGQGWRSYERRSADRIEATNGLARAHYLVALASDAPLPDIGSSVYLDRRRVHEVVEAARRLAEVEANAATRIGQAEARATESGPALEAMRLQAEARATEWGQALEAMRLQAEARATEWGQALEAMRLQAESTRLLYRIRQITSPLRRFATRLQVLSRWLRQRLQVIWWMVSLQRGTHLAAWRGARAQRPRAQPAADLRAAFISQHGDTPVHFAPFAHPEVSVIIPAYRGLDDVMTCLRAIALYSATEPSFEVILVDDCPDEPILKDVPWSGGLVKLANAQNLGFLRSCNGAAAAARGRVLCFLNSDTIVQQFWLRALVEALGSSPRAAIAGSMMLNRDGTIQDAGWRILDSGWGFPLGRGMDAQDGAHTHRRPVDCVAGACLAITRDFWNELGGFDEAYAPAFYEEFDLAFRAKARGMEVIYEPRSRVVHLGSNSYGPERRDTLSSAHQKIFAMRFADTLHRHPSDPSDAFLIRSLHPGSPAILVVDHGIPRPDRHAGDVTLAGYLSMLAGAGWRVIFAPHDGHATGPAAEALEVQGIELIRAPQTIEGWLREHGRHIKYAWLSRPAIAQEITPLIRAHSDALIAYYTHDLHQLRLAREAALHGGAQLEAEAERVREQEVAVLLSMDYVMTPSAEEAALIRDLAPGIAVSTIPPYYYDASEVRSQDAAHFAALQNVMFVGGFPHTPNVDAALFMAREVMPLVWHACPTARLLLVGYAPPPEVLALAGARVIVTGQVPELEPYFAEARLMLASLRYGAGVKGKVVEALRHGVPTVTTATGAEGIGITPGHDAIIAETPRALADAVISLLGDAERCAALSKAGAALVRARFSRHAACTALARVFQLSHCGIRGSAQPVTPPLEGN